MYCAVTFGEQSICSPLSDLPFRMAQPQKDGKDSADFDVLATVSVTYVCPSVIRSP